MKSGGYCPTGTYECVNLSNTGSCIVLTGGYILILGELCMITEDVHSYIVPLIKLITEYIIRLNVRFLWFLKVSVHLEKCSSLYWPSSQLSRWSESRFMFSIVTFKIKRCKNNWLQVITSTIYTNCSMHMHRRVSVYLSVNVHNTCHE